MQNVKHVFFFVAFFHFFYSYNHDSISLMRMQFRKIKKITSILTIFVVFLALPPLFAESRSGKLDLFVLMDRSLSMVEEFSSLQDYVSDRLIDILLTEGDSVTIIAFYGKTQHITSGVIGNPLSPTDLKGLISPLKPDKHYTDIGSALDELKVAIDDNSRSGYPDYVLLLTDGIHEGPPGSPYPGKTEEFEHPLRSPRKEISLDGWKIEILGITVEEEAGRLASDVIAAWQNRN